MYRDDEEAAQVRCDELRRELADIEHRLARARSVRWRRRALAALLVALPIAACAAARALPAVVDPRATVLLVDDGGTPEIRCRRVEGPACAELAAQASDPREAYSLYRRACLAGHRPSCITTGEHLLAGTGVAKNPRTALLLFAESCLAFSDADACALLRKACLGRSDEACGLAN